MKRRNEDFRDQNTTQMIWFLNEKLIFRDIIDFFFKIFEYYAFSNWWIFRKFKKISKISDFVSSILIWCVWIRIILSNRNKHKNAITYIICNIVCWLNSIHTFSSIFSKFDCNSTFDCIVLFFSITDWRPRPNLADPRPGLTLP